MKGWLSVRSTLASLVGLGILLGCKEEVPAPVAPSLVLTDVHPTTAYAHADSIYITLNYSDLQGDVGEPDPDVPSLSVRDQRLEMADWIHIPPVTPDLMELSVSGQLDVVLPPLFLLGNGSSEQTAFSLQLFDRAGNASEVLVTPEIQILDTL